MNKGEEKWLRSICTHIFLALGIKGLCDVRVIIMDKTNVDRPTQRKAFWVYKLDTFVPRGLDVRDFNNMYGNYVSN